MKKRIAAKLLSSTGLDRILAAALPQRGVLVLNYHRIGDGAESPYDRRLWSASAEDFDAQVAFLSREFDVIGPGDIDAALKAPTGRHVVITFDDGYLDNYRFAYPALRRHGATATFFIATGFIDNPTLPWWDEIAWLIRTTPAPSLELSPWFPLPVPLGDAREEAIVRLLARYKSLSSDGADRMLAALRGAAGVRHPARIEEHWMSWDMIREMDAGGMTIGGHTMHHPVLSRMPLERQRAEIEGCAARILAETGRRIEYFAYPVGNRDSFNADTRTCLEAIGIHRAFSYYGGYASPESPRYDTPRVAVECDLKPHQFKVMSRLPRIFCSRPYA